MSWCKFDDRADGEKMALAAAEVGDSAVAFWFRAVLHCSRNRTDGFVDARLVSRLTHHKRPLDVVDALVRAKVRPDGAGLLTPCDGGWMVHDYLAFNRSREQAEAEDARKEAERRAGRARAQAARDAKRAVYDQTARAANVRSDHRPHESVPYEIVPRASTRASPVPSRPVPSRAAEGACAPTAAAPLPDLAGEILSVATRLGLPVDAEFANALALIAERGGRSHLAAKALEEAAGAVAARAPLTVQASRDLIQRFVRRVRPEEAPLGQGGGGGSGTWRGGRHGAPGAEEPYNPFGPPTDEELRGAGVIP